jgi:hypothetical protein
MQPRPPARPRTRWVPLHTPTAGNLNPVENTDLSLSLSRSLFVEKRGFCFPTGEGGGRRIWGFSSCRSAWDEFPRLFLSLLAYLIWGIISLK